MKVETDAVLLVYLLTYLLTYTLKATLNRVRQY